MTVANNEPPSPATPLRIADGLWWLPGSVSNTFVWTTGQDVVVVDPGSKGDHLRVLETLGALSLPSAATVTIVLTHWHSDHSGAAGDLAAATGATVWAGQLDAEALRGERHAARPDFTAEEWEIMRPLLHANPDALTPPRCTAVRDLTPGQVFGSNPSATVLAFPGHTPGTVALHIPAIDALLTGDIAISDSNGMRTGPFNVDNEQARRAHAQLVAMNCHVLAVGHGTPYVGGDPVVDTPTTEKGAP